MNTVLEVLGIILIAGSFRDDSWIGLLLCFVGGAIYAAGRRGHRP